MRELFGIRTSDPRLAGRRLNHWIIADLLLIECFEIYQIVGNFILTSKEAFCLTVYNVNTHDYDNLLLHDITQTSAAERHLMMSMPAYAKVLGHVFTIKLT